MIERQFLFIWLIGTAPLKSCQNYQQLYLIDLTGHIFPRKELVMENKNPNLILNGQVTGARVDWRMTADGVLFNAAQFMQGTGGVFHPTKFNAGLVAQYGKRIGFSSNNVQYAMVQVQLCEMTPPSKSDDGIIWAPSGFFESVLDGKIVFLEDQDSISVTAPAPQQIGDIIPEAAPLSSALEQLGLTVSQGDICQSNAIEICYANYSPDANANNANIPYFCIQAPLPPDAKYSLLPQQLEYTLREDEGLLLIGRTPPKCDYYSYRSYFLERCISEVNPFDRKKIYTQLRDPINCYNIGEDVFYPASGPKVMEPFGSPLIIISTPGRKLYEDVLAAVEMAGLGQLPVLLDIVDSNLVKLGNDDYADTINFLHRFSNPADKKAADAYIYRPTLEIMRLTPKIPRKPDFLTPFPLRKRGSDITEDYLKPAAAALRQAIMDKYSEDYDIRELETHDWIAQTGAVAIDSLTNVLGETRDTLYLKTDDFVFNEDTIIVVYGVNHAMTPKSVYNNVSCYGAEYLNGFGGITNDVYQEDVVANFPSLSNIPNVENLYVWKFARTALDEYTFAVPQDVDDNLEGINNGATAFMGFRAYIDPNCPDLIGPAPGQIVFDRAMVLTPK